MRRAIPVLLLIAFAVRAADDAPFPRPRTPLDLRTYRAVAAAEAPTIDGALDDAVWAAAAWTEPFTDIEGPLRPEPGLRTVAAMSWDDDAFYFAARLREPHLWATLTQRDAVIYHDNDFEIFLDPDGDNHLYYELEINALNTVWDLLLVRPYRDGGPAVHAWDIPGLRTAVRCEGSLNDPADRDEGWTVEVAIPWAALRECAGPAAVPPLDGDRWRVNFSRVQWDLDVVDGAYVKRDAPEHNWTWSPQGLIAMHYPERWGVVEFASAAPDDHAAPPAIGAREHAAAALMHLYYEQREHERRRGRFACDAAALDLGLEGTGIEATGFAWPPELTGDGVRFRARVALEDGAVIEVDETGRVRGDESR